MQFRRGGIAGWLPEIVVCAALIAPACVQASTLRILAHETFRPIPAATQGAAKPASGSLRSLEFIAYGRRFTLQLELNPRLSRLLPDDAEGPAQTVYQGVVENMPGSWVRLSAKAQAIRGAIWDGRDLYLIDSSAALGESAGSGETIIFRLADTEVPAGSSFCRDTPAATAASGKDAYSQLLGELKTSPALMQAPGASLRLEISALADALFRARYASDRQAEDEILSRMNIVDGIYSSQLQVEIQVPTFNIDDAVAAQLPSSTNTQTLIDSLGQLRDRTPVLRARGLTHLFTGRDLDESTVGIAYTASLCSRRYGAALTQTSRSVTIDALIAAHEIGHNFGAPHDGEKECAATPQNQFLMSPSVNVNAQTFSDCSLEQIRPRIQAASCLLPLTSPDLSIPVDLGESTHAVGTPFSWELRVANSGGSIAYRSDLTLWVPPVVSILDAVVVGGSCTSGAGRVQCELGDIPAGGSRVATLTLRSDVVGSNSISARVHASGDSQTTNNAGDGTLIINPEADLSVSTQAPGSVQAGSPATVTFTATNSAPIDVSDVKVNFTVSGGVSIASGEITGGTCTTSGTAATCTLPTLAAGQSMSGTLTLDAQASGPANVRAAITGGYFDPADTNDSSERTITVVAAASSNSQPVRGRSGGGATSLWLLAALAFLTVLRSRGLMRC